MTSPGARLLRLVSRTTALCCGHVTLADQQPGPVQSD